MTTNDELLTVTEAAASAPVPVSLASMWRYMRRGTKARSGQRVFLKTIRVGNRLYTTRANILTFFEELASADMEHFRQRQEPIPRTRPEAPAPRERQREIARARLKAAGIG